MKLKLGTPWYRHEGPCLELELASRHGRFGFYTHLVAEIPGTVHVHATASNRGLVATVQRNYGYLPYVTAALSMPRLPHFGVGINASTEFSPARGGYISGRRVLRFGGGR